MHPVSSITLFGHTIQSTLPFYEILRSEGVTARYSYDGIRYLLASKKLHEEARTGDVSAPLALQGETLAEAQKVVVSVKGYRVAVRLESEPPLEFEALESPLEAVTFSGLRLYPAPAPEPEPSNAKSGIEDLLHLARNHFAVVVLTAFIVWLLIRQAR